MKPMQFNTAFEAICQRIAINAKLVRLWPLVGGVSACIDALEIEMPNGLNRIFVVRRPGETQWKDWQTK